MPFSNKTWCKYFVAQLGATIVMVPALADVMPTLLPPIEPGQRPQAATGAFELNQALNETFVRSPRAASVRQQLGIARAAIPQALTFPNPSLIVYNGFKAEQTYQVGASIPVEPPWKVFFRLATAKNQIRQADLEILRLLWQLRGTVRRAYLEVVISEEIATATSELAELTRQLQVAAQKRANAGDVARLDVLKAQLATAQAEVERDQSTRQVTLAKRRLNVVVGRNHAAELEVPRLPAFQLRATQTELLPNLEQTMPDLSSLIALAHEKRLDVRLVRQQIRTTESALRNTYASIFPNTQLNVGHSITGNPPDGPKLHGYFIGITQEIPLLNFQQGDIARYRATLNQLNIELRSQQNVISEEVAVAFERVQIARERIRAYQEHLLAQSEEVARLARRSYEVGQSDILSALLAQQQNVQVRNQYLEAVRSYQQAITDLEQAVGQPL